MLTGEPVPVLKEVDESVSGSTVNGDGMYSAEIRGLFRSFVE